MQDFQWQKAQDWTLEGRGVRVWQPAGGSEGLPALCLFADEGVANDLLPLLAFRIREGACRPFVLALPLSQDWNRDYTPWPAPALFEKDAPFAGGGSETRAWLEESLLPALRRHCAVSEKFEDTLLLGYSLGGLFALWAALQSSLAGGCGSCSGSLWYDGFGAWAAAQRPQPGSRVYFSLGEKEEKAKNHRMAQVGDATRRLYAQMQGDEAVRETTLQWHAGGHFADVAARLAKGVVWLAGWRRAIMKNEVAPVGLSNILNRAVKRRRRGETQKE